jgi:hypothetical protein
MLALLKEIWDNEAYFALAMVTIGVATLIFMKP